RVDTCDIGAYEFGVSSTNQPLPVIPTNVLNGLTISRGTNLVTLSWPAGYTNLFLQFATNLLATNTAWSLSSTTPSTNSGSNTVSVSTTNVTPRSTFYRLFGLTNLA